MDSISARPWSPSMTHCLHTMWSSHYYRKSFINYILKEYMIARRSFDDRINCVVSEGLCRGHDDVTILKTVARLFSALRFRENYETLRADNRALIVAKLVPQANTYLDFGCGDGSITERIAELTGAKTVYGVELQPVAASVQYLASTSSLPAESVDLITAFVSLHHVSHLEIDHKMCEFYRILRPGGTLIIREHDSDNSDEFMCFLNLIHIFIEIDCQQNNHVNAGAIIQGINYRSACDWTKKICDSGFNLGGYIRYDGNNPQKLYYAHYHK